MTTDDRQHGLTKLEVAMQLQRSTKIIHLYVRNDFAQALVLDDPYIAPDPP